VNSPIKELEGTTVSVKATAVIKKETKVDPKKPNDKAYYATLSVLNEDCQSVRPSAFFQ
jgi:hypothetical protein